MSSPQPTDTLARPGEPVLDARERAGQDSCASLTNTAVDELGPGASFVLVADHDPVGLQYMLAAERPGETDWELLQDGPVTWQARITRRSVPTG
jgi:uncharacterized protein (DUF2249 family)